MVKPRLYQKSFQLLRFLLAGLPAFAVVVPLNWSLVEFARLPKPLAYALVLIVQVSVNFFMCRAFVFKKRDDRSIRKQFIQFFVGIIAFRIADWTVYTIAVEFFGVYYLLMQFIDIVIFSLMKFEYSRRVLEHRPPAMACSNQR